MSLFFENNCTNTGALKPNLIVAHSNHLLIASAWSNPASVLITDGEGEFLAVVKEQVVNNATKKMNSSDAVTSLAWHPYMKILVIGWSSGKMTAWSVPEEPLEIDVDIHSKQDYQSNAYLALCVKGAVSSEIDNSMKEHNNESVVMCEWSTHGQYLVSSSLGKKLVLWMFENNIDNKAARNVMWQITHSWSITTENPVTRLFHLKFTDRPSESEYFLHAASNEESGPADGSNFLTSAGLNKYGTDEISFLLIDGGNRVLHLDDSQHINVLLTVEKKILEVLYDSRERLLVVSDAGQMLEAHRVTEDVKVTQLLRRKLPVSASAANGEKIPITMCWAETGKIAFGCGDDRIRIFDLERDTVLMLTVPQENSQISFVMTQIQKRILVAGTTDGTLAIFYNRGRLETGPRNNSGIRRENGVLGNNYGSNTQDASSSSQLNSAASQWEFTETRTLGDRIDRIIFTYSGDMAISSGGCNLHVLHEAVRQRSWDGVAAATQISSDMVVIESITGCQCLLKSRSKIRGLSTCFPYIALWSGTQIDLHLINESASTHSLVNSITTSSPAFAVHQDGILYAKDGRIFFASFQLQNIAKINFTDAEGVPILINVMNDFIVIVSSKNMMRLLNVKSLELRSLGPPRTLTFTEPISVSSSDEAVSSRFKSKQSSNVRVVEARVNAQGRRVALMTKTGLSNSVDTKIWVYDSGTDTMISFDFAPRNEVPNSLYWNTPEPNSGSIGELEYLLLACETHKKRTPGGDGVNGDVNAIAENNTGGIRTENHEAMPDMEAFAEKKDEEGPRNASSSPFPDQVHNLVTLFATPKKLFIHNSVSLKRYQICLVGLTIPDFLLASVKINGNPGSPEDYVIEQKRLKDFDGLKSDKDVAIREALMKFSYYSATGNMDEAYRCIKSIKNNAVWNGLAKMCVTTGNLDVAEVCLGNLQDVVTAGALRSAKEEYPNDKRVQLATLACGLSMIEECEQLLRESGRFDLITDVLLASGKFEQAQKHTERYDRIRIRPVAYKYAQFMESLQNMDAAIMWYYNAKCAATDVPRIYFQTNRLQELREYILPPQDNSNKPERNIPGTGVASEDVGNSSIRRASTASDDPRTTFAALFSESRELQLWWAQYSERRRNTQEALRCYHAGKDFFNVVRILCTNSPPKIDYALEIVNSEVERCKNAFQKQQAQALPGMAPTEPETVGAAYFIGKYYEKNGDVDSALEYYRYAGASYSAACLARDQERFHDLVTVCLSSGDNRLVLSNALYLEQQEEYEKAVELYRKANATQCAIHACIKGGLFDTLHQISTGLVNTASRPAVFVQMANHFKESGHYQKAVEMLVFAKRYDDALNLCEEQNVTLTDDMAETMTDVDNKMPQEERVLLLKKIAHIAREQGNWNLACKKYTQAGERLKAMKMLMRGGDANKVIFFANHCRDTEIYVLAANFLQSQDWNTKSHIYETIITFYTKAKAYTNLASFHEACSHVQIDENRNYTSALHSIQECVKTLERAGSNGSKDSTKLQRLKQRLTILSSFVKAQRLVDSMDERAGTSLEEKQKGEEAVAIASDLIKRSRGSGPDHDLIEESLRIGDVFALLLKYYFLKTKEPKHAMKVLESMPKHGAEPKYYVEQDLIENICSANGRKADDFLKTTVSSGVNNADINRAANNIDEEL